MSVLGNVVISLWLLAVGVFTIKLIYYSTRGLFMSQGEIRKHNVGKTRYRYRRNMK